MRIAIISHAASPVRGSEPGLTWGWAWYLSQRHDVWLVHFPEFRGEVEEFLELHPNDRLKMVWVNTPPRLDPWDPKASSTGARFKIHYFLWLAALHREVKRLVAQSQIELVHQVGLMTVSAPSRLWCLPVPLVWGPLGGGETAPAAFRTYYGADWGRERNRRLRLQLVGNLPPLRGAARYARQMFAVNHETRAVLIRAGADPHRVAILLDAGVHPESLRSSPRGRPTGTELKLVWVGRLEARKALPILLDAMALAARAPDANSLPPLRLQVAGKGPKHDEWECHARALGLSKQVTFLGGVPPSRMGELYEQSDLFVFTSLQDAFGTVVMEALASALPSIVLNHQGCAAVVPDEAVIKIPVTEPTATVAALAGALNDVRRRPDQLASLSRRALAAARDALWPDRAAAMTRVYEQVLAGTRRLTPEVDTKPYAA